MVYSWLRVAAVACVLVASTSIAQEQQGDVEPNAAGAESTLVDPVPRDPRPNVRDQILQNVLDVLLTPRPRPAPVDPPLYPEPEGEIADIQPQIPETSVPTPAPRPAPVAIQTPVQTAPATPAAKVPKPRPATGHVAPTPSQVAQAPAEPPRVPEATPAPEPPAAVAPAAPPAPAVDARAEPVSQPPQVTRGPLPAAPSPEPAGTNWLLLAVAALIAAAAVTSAALKVRNHRRIAKTRAALGLVPSLDPTAGSSPTPELAFAGPRLAIRTRLELGAPAYG